MSEWQEIPLDQAVVINPQVKIASGSDVPFVDMKQVVPGQKVVCAVERRTYTGGGSKFVSGDTLMARITPCLENGKIGQYRSHDITPTNGSTEFIVFRGRSGVTDNDFVYYLVSSPAVRQFAIGQMTGTSGRQRVPTDCFSKFTLKLPPLKEQEEIAALLAALDNQIELSRKQNETLEAMARAIFKSWFVDFDPVRAKSEGRPPEGMDAATAALFPSTFTDSPLGPIPDGWTDKPLSEIADLNPTERLSKGTVAPYIDMAALPTRGFWPEPPVEREFGSGTKFRNGDTLLARITPCLENGKTAYISRLDDDIVAWGSTEYIVIRPKAPVRTELGYLLARDPMFRDHAIRSMTGTSGRQRSQADVVGAYKIAIPSDEAAMEATMQAFASLVRPIFRKIKSNALEAETLAKVRDTLLPRLISGKLRLTDAQALTEDAA